MFSRAESLPAVQSRPRLLNMLLLRLKTQGKYDEAEPLYRESLGIRRKALPEAHPAIATALNNLAGLLKAQVSFCLLALNRRQLSTADLGC